MGRLADKPKSAPRSVLDLSEMVWFSEDLNPSIEINPVKPMDRLIMNKRQNLLLLRISLKMNFNKS